MTVAPHTPDMGPGDDPAWILWSNHDQTRLERFRPDRWEHLLGDRGESAVRLFVFGVSQSAEFRRLSGRGWKGRLGTRDSNAPSLTPLRLAGDGSLDEPRLNAAAAFPDHPGSLPLLGLDFGFLPGSAQPVWLPFLESPDANPDS